LVTKKQSCQNYVEILLYLS